MMGKYTIISFLMLSLQNIIQFICFENILTPDNSIMSKKKRSFIAISFGIVMMWIKTSDCFNLRRMLVVQSLIAIVCLLLFLHFLYKEKLQIKIIHTAVILFQGVAADIICHAFFIGEMPDLSTFTYNCYETAKISVIATLIFLVINLIYTFVILKYKKKAAPGVEWIISIMIFVFIIVLIEYTNNKGDAEIYLMFASIMTIFVFSFLAIYVNYLERKEKDDELRKLQQAIEVEKSHYKQIEQNSKEMAKIRHDYNNIIESVRSLLRDNKYEEAEKILDELSGKISRTSGIVYCPVSIVNAVLNYKKTICDNEGIDLFIDIIIPDVPDIETLDLCVILGNMMDNSIRECKEINAKGGKGSIIVSARKINGYLVFKVKNTCMENKDNIIKGTGYGHKILSDIADKYKGDFHTSYEDGIYVSCISLRL